MEIPGLYQTLNQLDQLHFLDALLRGRSVLPRRSLVVLTYHRVLEPGTELDEGVVSATPAEFDDHLGLIRRHGHIVTIEALCAALAGGEPLPDNAVMITFDDGYRDNYVSALPLLVNHGLQAVFFVTTGFIGTGQLPWWDRISYVVKRTRMKQLRLEYPVPLTLELGSARQINQSRRSLLRTVKQVYRLDLDRFFHDLEDAAQVQVDAAALADGLFMDWAEVRALQQAGMDIGAHTHSHRVLQTLTLQDAAQDLRRSQDILRAQLGVTPRAIAYPVGFPVSVGLHEVIRQVGYDVGFVFTKGVIPTHRLGEPNGIDRFNLPRMAVEVGRGAWFKAALLAPDML